MTRDDARCVAGALAAVLLVAGCGPRQAFRAGEDWRRAECERIVEADERERCLESGAGGYDEYRRARDEALGPAG